MATRILLLAEDTVASRSLIAALQQRATEITIRLAASSDGALDVLRTGRVDGILLPDPLPSDNVFRALRRLRAQHPRVPIVVLAAAPSIRGAVQAMKLGAADYVETPDRSGPAIAAAVHESFFRNRDAAHDGTTEPWRPTARPSPGRAALDRIVGETPLMRALRRAIGEIGATAAPVLILGETGTGKELVASALHEASARAHADLAPVNCAELSEGLFEAELFGHVRGAYTGAYRDNPGLVRAACGSTLFFDEIGELPLAQQAKLLRLIEFGVVRPIGASGSFVADVRIIAATNRDLRRAVAAGSFRQDLYHRLAVHLIEVPPLRKRRDDIPLLVRDILARNGSFDVRRVSAAAMAQLLTAHWPGNVRELENVLQRACVRRRDGIIPGFEIDEPIGPETADGLEHLLLRSNGDLQVVAQELGVHVRTVQRRLKHRGLRRREFVAPCSPADMTL